MWWTPSDADGLAGDCGHRPGKDADFVSRSFCPELGLEDPVTGSARSSLAPLWSRKLGKTALAAGQISPQGGVLRCHVREDAAVISGRAALYLQGPLLV